ncbi:MAG: N-acetyltransferase family protein [Ginsengibacter sp.]
MNKLRVATPGDAVPILDIYSPYILNTSVTFEMEVPGISAFSERITGYLESWPWLVYEVDGDVAGYAYGTRHRERIAYQWCVETSVYVDSRFQKQGIAIALYDALIEILNYQGFRNLYAGINLPNDKSVAFHEKCGFTWFANYKNVGYKLGQWKTVGWWIRRLNEYSDDPKPPLKFSELEPGYVNGVLSKYS